jgi:hypothetical protein
MLDVHSRHRILKACPLDTEWQYDLLTVRTKKQISGWGSEDTRTHSDSWDVAIIINQAPLVTDHIQLQNMVVNLISVLVESSKGIDLVIAAESDRGVYETRRPLT